MRHPVRKLSALAVSVVLLGTVAMTAASADDYGAIGLWPTYGQTFTLNPSGGTNGSDGLRVMFGGGQVNSQRFANPDDPERFNGEIYGPRSMPGTGDASGLFTQIALAVGDEAGGGTAFVAPSFYAPWSDRWSVDRADNVTLEQWNVVTTTSGNQITSVMTGEADGLTYTVTVVLTYTAPDDRMKFDYTVTIPAGNTKPVRLYHLIDTFLGGSDQGPGFFLDPQACGTSGYSGAVVGVDRADLGVVEAFQYVSGAPWAGYISGYYNDVVFGDNYKTDPDLAEGGPHLGPGFMNDLNNVIIADPSNDNGIGINWNFGSTAGSFSSAAKLIFSPDAVSPCEDVEAISPTNPDPTLVPDPDIDTDSIDDPTFDPLKDPEPIVNPSYTG
ncbi:MAG: hypothetical protein FGM58_07365 [Acidimicrobiia bacterium]|nr:hypothetical protein [Acidimicrobiia bacterium]